MVQRERAALERRLTELHVEEAVLDEVIAGCIAQQPDPEVMGKAARNLCEWLDRLYQAGAGPTGTAYVTSSLRIAINIARQMLAKEDNDAGRGDQDSKG